MSYPQPSSVRAVQNYGQFFRVKTPIASGGDLYQSEVSGLGFVLGPDSDLASVKVTYFDADNTGNGNVSSAIISPDRSMIGRVNAMVDDYPLSDRRGRILISPNDIFDPLFLPASFAGGDSIQIEQPVLDVIQYFDAPPSLVTQRSDKIWRAQYFVTPPGPGTAAWWVIPAYGRKSGYFTFLNLDGVTTVTVRVFGVKLSISGVPAPAGTMEIQLTTAAILAGGTHVYEFLSSTEGLWDLFAIKLENYQGLAMPTTITLSDDPL